MAVGALAVSSLTACSGAVTVAGVTANPSGAGDGDVGQTSLRCPAGSLAGFTTTTDEPLATASRDDYGAACDNQAQIEYGSGSVSAATEAFLTSQATLIITENAWPADDEADDRCESGVSQFPLAALPIAVVYNVAGIKRLTLTPDVLSAILLGEITRWDDGMISELNPKEELPDKPITVIAPTGETATTAALTGYLADTGASGWGKSGSAEWEGGGQEATDSGAVAQDVLATVGAIGFTEWPSARAVNVPWARIKTEAKTITLKESSVTLAMTGAKLRGSGPRFDLKIVPPEKGYPILRPVYVQTCADGLDPGKLSLLKDYLSYSLSGQWQSGLSVHEAGAIPDDEREKLLAAVNEMS